MLAAHNGARWIGQQIESILAQEQADLHVIVRDDGSSDSTLETIESLQATDRVSVSRHSPGSGSAAQSFLALIREPRTLARIEHMLETGKPLRN